MEVVFDGVPLIHFSTSDFIVELIIIHILKNKKRFRRA